jgi:exoribonuclease R
VAARPTVIRGADLDVPLRTLRTELGVPGEFSSDVIADAAHAASSWDRSDRVDATDLPLVTLDPAGSRDLDQAFALESVGNGFRFHYAIADVAAFVTPSGPMAEEALRRGETLYLPDGRAPLYPPSLSEGAASLLPDGDRPAVLWRLDLDGDAELTTIDVRRAVVRSRAQLDYPTLATERPEIARLLSEVGALRQQREQDRGGISLDVPEQDVSRDGAVWTLEYRSPLPAEGWNAQLSLLTGMAAARLMVEAKIGLLRTMPTPNEHTVAALQRSASALGISWPHGTSYPAIVRSLDPTKPAHAAMLRLASTLFRGARYTAFDGTVPNDPNHAAVAAPYAHATAPLRRLADRFVSETCLAICNGKDVPEWVRETLPALPDIMSRADQHAHQVDRAVVDLAETVLLQDRVGETFNGVVVDAGDDHGEVQLTEPAVRARLDGANLPLGQSVAVRLVSADVSARRLTFSLDRDAGPR